VTKNAETLWSQNLFSNNFVALHRFKFKIQKRTLLNLRRGCKSTLLEDLGSLENLLAVLPMLGRELTGGELLQASHLDDI